MTDEELIKSLRSVAGGKLLYTNTPNHLRFSAADRIEKALDECDEALAKLAQAVEFIREVRRNGDTRLASMAMAVLAKLEA